MTPFLRPRSSAAVLVVAIALLLVGCDDEGDPADGGVATAPTGAPDEAPAPAASTPVPAPTPTPGATASPEPDQAPEDEAAPIEREMERFVFELVNDERRERGLEPLEWDEQLAELARGWSAQMAEEGRLEHQDPEVMLERAEGFSGVGENIFRATGPVPASTVHVGWMRSEQHRVNVLSADFDRLGIGFVCAEDGLWATQRFGRSGAPGPLSPAEDVPPEEPIVASEGEGPACPGGGPQLQLDLG